LSNTPPSSNSNENDNDIDYMINMINNQSNQNDYNNEIDDMFTFSENKTLENDLKKGLNKKIDDKQIITLISKILKNKKGKITKPDNSIKSFIQNKMTNYLTNSDLTEKLLLYNLISKNNNVNNIDEGIKVNQNDFLGSFNKIFDQDTIEKYFQKEVIRFTIENFCNYLKNNGYTILKNCDDEVSEDEEDKTNKKQKEIICPHTDRKHYAKVLLLI
jgi:hypothetical protein